MASVRTPAATPPGERDLLVALRDARDYDGLLTHLCAFSGRHGGLSLLLPVRHDVLRIPSMALPNSDPDEPLTAELSVKLVPAPFDADMEAIRLRVSDILLDRAAAKRPEGAGSPERAVTLHASAAFADLLIDNQAGLDIALPTGLSTEGGLARLLPADALPKARCPDLAH